MTTKCEACGGRAVGEFRCFDGGERVTFSDLFLCAVCAAADPGEGCRTVSLPERDEELTSPEPFVAMADLVQAVAA